MYVNIKPHSLTTNVKPDSKSLLLVYNGVPLILNPSNCLQVWISQVQNGIILQNHMR